MTLKINGTEIPDELIEQEFHRLLNLYVQRVPAEQLQQYAPAIRRMAKNHVIGRTLLLAEAERQEIEVSAVEIENEVDELRRKCGRDDIFAAHLEKHKLTPELLRDTIRSARLVEKLTDQVTGEVTAPDDTELNSYFDAHPDEFVSAESVEASHILIKCDTKNDAEKAAAKSKMDMIRAELDNGASFAELAGKHSDCPSGKSTGGNLGKFQRGVMVPEFEAAVFALADNEYSDPVLTQFGYHLIQAHQHHPALSMTFEDIKEQLREDLLKTHRNQALEKFVGELRQKAIIDDGEDSMN